MPTGQSKIFKPSNVPLYTKPATTNHTKREVQNNSDLTSVSSKKVVQFSEEKEEMDDNESEDDKE